MIGWFLELPELGWIKDFPTCGGSIGLKNTPNLGQPEPYMLDHRKLSVATCNKRLKLKKRKEKKRYFGGGV